MPRKRRAVASPTAPSIEELRKRWERVADLERAVYRKPEKAPRLARGREVVAALRAMYAATGDSAFDAALNAIKTYGFEQLDAGTLKRTRANTFGTDETEAYYPRMRQLIERERGASVRQAAAQVAYTWHISGTSFETVITTLAKGYQEWRHKLGEKVRA
jgi:hypothetical protein